MAWETVEISPNEEFPISVDWALLGEIDPTAGDTLVSSTWVASSSGLIISDITTILVTGSNRKSFCWLRTGSTPGWYTLVNYVHANNTVALVRDRILEYPLHVYVK